MLVESIGNSKYFMKEFSGRYLLSGNLSEFDLRVDFDGNRPCKIISMDIFRIRQNQKKYTGSLYMRNASLKSSDSLIEIFGTPEYSPSIMVRHTYMKVLIQREFNNKLAVAKVEWYKTENGPVVDKVTIPFNSNYFRSVECELDYTKGIKPFDIINDLYDTTSLLPSAAQPRKLSVAKAYQEAGIELISSGESTEVPEGSFDLNDAWTEKGLNDLMAKRFSLHKNEPQWKIWIFATTWLKDNVGSGGRMFDWRNGSYQRQGCALFHITLNGTESDPIRRSRRILRAYVHEIGHCFNLAHSSDKGRPNAISWMREVEDSEWDAYWPKFTFEFDDLELAHLRHAFYENIIMGGNDLYKGSDSIK